MGTNPEHMGNPPDAPEEPVTWIGRDRVGFERVPVPDPAPLRAAPAAEPPVSGVLRRWLIPAAVVTFALLLASASFVLMGRKPHVTPLAHQKDVPLVTVMTPPVKDVTANVSFTGAIAARYDMPIANEGDTARIVGVYVEPGDHVLKGQLLARLDDSILIPQVNRLAASLEQARAQAELSAAEYKRALGVEAAGALSAEDIEKRRATAVTDAASVKVAAAQLAEAQARLARTRIVAPFAGTVLTRHAEVGQIANPGGEALFRVASGGEVEMRGQIAEQDLAQVKVGEPATVYLTGLARPFEGTVRLLGAIIDPQTRLGDIRIALKPDPALRPGAFAHADVTVAKARRPVLPQTAVFSDSAGSYVLLVDGQGQVVRRAVRVAQTSEAGVVIAAGLSGDERVVRTAGGFLRDGESVKVATEAEQASRP
ncbi:MAG TPA: efflux RND transporter periplasmic adaptor subunit [Steroidobacteraceae bacterium]|nr:efflux RND transporter periplasmic adaptor subunit [Steroidobacteraceae bacterium]